MTIDDCRFGLSIDDSTADWRLAIPLPIAQSKRQSPVVIQSSIANGHLMASRPSSFNRLSPIVNPNLQSPIVNINLQSAIGNRQ
jgi:hypothetical protein